jgi:hypothetical protein
MKKLIMSVTACVLLGPILAAAKTFNGEIMDSQCAKVGGHTNVQENGHQRP